MGNGAALGHAIANEDNLRTEFCSTLGLYDKFGAITNCSTGLITDESGNILTDETGNPLTLD